MEPIINWARRSGISLLKKKRQGKENLSIKQQKQYIDKNEKREALSKKDSCFAHVPLSTITKITRIILFTTLLDLPI